MPEVPPADPRDPRTAPRLAAAVLAYFVLQFVLRVAGPGWGVEKDEAEQLLWTQQLALGYGTQPPLYTWLQAAVFALTGPGIAGLALLKNLLLAATVLLMADSARRLLPPRAAVAATAALALLPPLSWEAQRDLSHSVLLVFAAALTLWAIVRLLQQRRRSADYLVLGLAAATGLLAKYSYVLLAAAWLAALASVPEGRALLRDRRFLLATLLPAALLVLPHALWVLGHWDDASSGTLDKLDGADAAGWLAQRLHGLRALLRALAGFAALWALVMLLLFVRRRSPAASAPAGPWPRLVRAYGVAVGLLLVVLVVAGAGAVKSRWLLPLLLPLPLFAFVAWPAWVARPRALAALATTGGALALLIAVALEVRPVWEAARGRVNDVHLPVRALAAAIGPLPAGVPLLAAPSHLAGSLRLVYPHQPITVLAADTPLPPGAVVVVEAGDTQAAALVPALAPVLGTPQALALTPAGGEARARRLRFLLWRSR